MTVTNFLSFKGSALSVHRKRTQRLLLLLPRPFLLEKENEKEIQRTFFLLAVSYLGPTLRPPLAILGATVTMATDLSNSSLAKPTNQQGGILTRKLGTENRRNTRRALSVINQNLGITSSKYPCVANKRPLTEECVNLPNVLKRPITRKLAAQLQDGQQEQENCFKENKKPTNQIEDCKITDVEEFKPASDLPVPMSPEPTRSVLSDKNQMEEVEMEDIFEDPVIDIDSCDAKNSLAVVDYVGALYAFYRKMEASSCVPTDYMSHQFDINEKMRAILIDWIIDVQYKFELREETLFLTVNLIDRFLSRDSVARKKLQLVGLAAMLLACKYEEVSVPIVEDMIFISDKAYTRKDLLDMEKLMCNKLQFNLSLPTPYVFLNRFLKAAESDKKLEFLSFFLIELSLVEYEMVKFQPSLLAAAAVYTAQCALQGFKQWSKTCEWYSTFSEDQLMECSRLMVGFHQRAGSGKLTGVYRKYSTSKFGYAAKFQPALFLVDDDDDEASSTNRMQFEE
ncbi:hypothetical protein V2J09_002271 [Rumex salicifolius]